MSMMQKIALSGCLAAMLLMPLRSFADAPAANPAFDRIKQLAGDWEGHDVSPVTGKEETINVRYEVTSGGTSVMERNFMGTPQEMVSMYYPDGQGVSMTHYCMLGNRPVLTLNKADDKSLAFEMNGLNGITSADEPHMHGLVLTFDGQNQLKQDWACAMKSDGSNGHYIINLTRK